MLTMTTTILVTGATGTIGSQVVQALRNAPGVSVRAAVRGGEEKASGLTGDNVTAVDFDFADEKAIAKALEGVDKAFLLTPFVEQPVELGARFVEAAKRAGVKHIVKLSAIGCEQEPGIVLGRNHRAIEKLVEASGIAWTFLRPNNFYENFFNYYGPDAQGNIYLPWGTAAASFLAGADIAAAAKATLTGEGHEGKAYTLTGPAALSIAEAAKTIGEVSGRTVTYVDVPEEAAKSAMLGAHLPAWMVDAMMELHAIDKAGYAAGLTDDLATLTGSRGMTFAAFAKAHAAKWKV
jgi:uncharacterized protein YbjT (DUF2867 family)